MYGNFLLLYYEFILKHNQTIQKNTWRWIVDGYCYLPNINTRQKDKLMCKHLIYTGGHSDRSMLILSKHYYDVTIKLKVLQLLHMSIGQLNKLD